MKRKRVDEALKKTKGTKGDECIELSATPDNELLSTQENDSEDSLIAGGNRKRKMQNQLEAVSGNERFAYRTQILTALAIFCTFMLLLVWYIFSKLVNQSHIQSPLKSALNVTSSDPSLCPSLSPTFTPVIHSTQSPTKYSTPFPTSVGSIRALTFSPTNHPSRSLEKTQSPTERPIILNPSLECRHMFANQPLIQISPIRSGSTLVYNILKRIFPDNEVTKKHNKMHYNHEQIYFITIRHPYNSIISSMLRFGQDLNDTEKFDWSIEEYLKNGGTMLLEANESEDNIYVFRYDEFHHDMSRIWQQIGCSVPTEVEEELENEFSVQGVLNQTSKYDSFMEWDKTTQLHGDHISKFKGETDYHELLTKDQLEKLQKNEKLKRILDKYF